MALGPCRECGREVSTQAQACPHCGVQIKIAAPKAGVGTGFAIVCGALLFGAAVIGVVSGKNSDSSSAPPTFVPPVWGVAHLQDKKYMIVWKSQFAYNRGIGIMRATNGTNDTLAALLISSFVACLPSGGEAVTIVAATVETREIIIQSGVNKGCRGVVQDSAVAP